MNALPKVGDQIKIIGNTNSHNYERGKTYVVVEVHTTGDKANYFVAKNLDTGVTGNYLQPRDVELVPESQLTQAHFRSKVSDLRRELKMAEDYLRFMEDSNLDKVTEQQLAAYRALSILDDKDTSMLERADRLALLIKHLK